MVNFENFCNSAGYSPVFKYSFSYKVEPSAKKQKRSKETHTKATGTAQTTSHAPADVKVKSENKTSIKDWFVKKKTATRVDRVPDALVDLTLFDSDSSENEFRQNIAEQPKATRVKSETFFGPDSGSSSDSDSLEIVSEYNRYEPSAAISLCDDEESESPAVSALTAVVTGKTDVVDSAEVKDSDSSELFKVRKPLVDETVTVEQPKTKKVTENRDSVRAAFVARENSASNVAVPKSILKSYTGNWLVTAPVIDRGAKSVRIASDSESCTVVLGKGRDLAYAEGQAVANVALSAESARQAVSDDQSTSSNFGPSAFCDTGSIAKDVAKRAAASDSKSCDEKNGIFAKAKSPVKQILYSDKDKTVQLEKDCDDADGVTRLNVTVSLECRSGSDPSALASFQKTSEEILKIIKGQDDPGPKRDDVKTVGEPVETGSGLSANPSTKDVSEAGKSPGASSRFGEHAQGAVIRYLSSHYKKGDLDGKEVFKVFAKTLSACLAEDATARGMDLLSGQWGTLLYALVPSVLSRSW